MSKPLLLDLFCGAGGAAMGYHRAGFEVVGVDIKVQPRYPFEFIQADALEYPLDGFDVVHASPPCAQATQAGHLRDAQGKSSRYGDLITPTRARLAGSVSVIENVPGAPIRADVTLCGSMFGLAVRRHRWFEFGCPTLSLVHPCNHYDQGRPVGIYYKLADDIPHGGRTAVTVEMARSAMGIDWMTWPELTQAIPPAYTEYVGRQLMRAL